MSIKLVFILLMVVAVVYGVQQQQVKRLVRRAQGFDHFGHGFEHGGFVDHHRDHDFGHHGGFSDYHQEHDFGHHDDYHDHHHHHGHGSHHGGHHHDYSGDYDSPFLGRK